MLRTPDWVGGRKKFLASVRGLFIEFQPLPNTCTLWVLGMVLACIADYYIWMALLGCIGVHVSPWVLL